MRLLPFDSLTSFYIYVITGLAVFFVGILTAMIVMGFLIIADTVSGIIASVRAGEPFSSRKLANMASKFLLYQLVIISAHAIDLYMIGLPMLLTATLSGLSLIEFTSIVENVDKATGINLWSYIRNIVKRKFYE